MGIPLATFVKPSLNGKLTRARQCPACGQPIPGMGLCIDLNRNVVADGLQTIQLTPQETEVLYLLARNAPHIVSLQSLAFAIWAGQDGPTDERSALFATISRLRRKLKPFGLTVRNSMRAGYVLEPAENDARLAHATWSDENIARLTALCGKQMPVDWIASEMGWTATQIRSLHRWLCRKGQSLPPLLRVRNAKTFCRSL